MKKYFIILSSFLVLSCSNTVTNINSSLKLKNGHGEEINVQYSYTGGEINKDSLYYYINDASNFCKSKCKHKPSYIPKGVTSLRKNDTISVMISFECSNSYGVNDIFTNIVEYNKCVNLTKTREDDEYYYDILLINIRESVKSSNYENLEIVKPMYDSIWQKYTNLNKNQIDSIWKNEILNGNYSEPF